MSGENRTTQAKFECTSCGHTANADPVGALNVANRAGLVLPDVASPPTGHAPGFIRGRSHRCPNRWLPAPATPCGLGVAARRGAPGLGNSRPPACLRAGAAAHAPVNRTSPDTASCGESRLPGRRAQRMVARAAPAQDSARTLPGRAATDVLLRDGRALFDLLHYGFPCCDSPTPASHPPPNAACTWLARRNFPLAFPYVVWLTRGVVPYGVRNLEACCNSKLSRSVTRTQGQPKPANAVAFAQRPTKCTSDRSAVASADRSLIRRRNP
ncbi:hypothetical protein SAMN05444921_13323 [Streptomyces wuyuanensis]|uniref:Transposase DNA-binding domain-containing protein n=1 Tax=Streptomyces wuyuanensis TaxID=1196353 RepID=A0A1H0DCC3_9ACTN|nr:hypothetical protein SAMN05444921_13323 [Streptomyces wuyuanensis]